ncbi:hypothetical protein P4233_08750 [Pseudomonas aeruginosa]|nr:hypothetical protein [Pseudomonas aeruginosa]
MDIRSPLNQCIALSLAASCSSTRSSRSTRWRWTRRRRRRAWARQATACPSSISPPNGAGCRTTHFRGYNVGANRLILNNATGKTQVPARQIILGITNLKGQAAW